MGKIDFSNVIENDYELGHYKKLHKEILNFLNKNSSTTFQEIVKVIGGSDRRVLRLLEEMDNLGELEISNKKIKAKNNSEPNFLHKDVSCESCNSKIIPLNGKLRKIVDLMREIHSKKPTPTFVYDQRPVNVETTVRRAAYLLWRNDLFNKEILVLGDDDLTSIAIALMGMAKRIVVLDIDERVINFINEIAKKHDLKIEGRIHDFNDGMPKDLESNFDVFLTDPTPNRECFELFVSHGLEFLKNIPGMIGYVSFFPSHQELSLDFQEVLNDKGLLVTDMIPRFTEYDFLKFTYNKDDLSLLEKFDNGETKISFYENITRFETTKKTLEEMKVKKPKRKALPLSKALKRIIENPSLDPAYSTGQEEFVLKEINKIKESENE